MIGQILNDMLQGQVSLERIQQFMCSEEINTDYISTEKNDSDEAITIKNGNFLWTSKTEETSNDKGSAQNYILKNINMEIKKGSFVAILGE